MNHRAFMKRVHLLFAITAGLLLHGCLWSAGPMVAKTSVKQPIFDAAGLRLHITVECQHTATEHTAAKPAACPTTPIPADVSLRTPWGRMYQGSVVFEAAAPHVVRSPGPAEHGAGAGRSQPAVAAAPRRSDLVAGVLAVKIDWKVSGVDPLGVLDASMFRSGWLVVSKDGRVNAPLIITNDEVRSMLTVIGEASGGAAPGDDDVGRADEHAALTAKLTNDLDPSGANRIILSITNQGPDPAYKVVAQLRSSATAIHGIQLSFGRINRGETKHRFSSISMTSDTDEPNPMVSAAVSSGNAPPSTTNSRLHLTAVTRPRPVPLQLACSSLDPEAVPGQRLRLQCESTNTGEAPIRGMSYQLAIGKAAATPASGPAELAARAHVKFELTPTLPSNVPAGSSAPITITIDAPDFLPMQQQITVRISESRGVCKQGKLTREAYRTKRKRLQDALAAKTLTQQEFDTYDAEMVSCLEVTP